MQLYCSYIIDVYTIMAPLSLQDTIQVHFKKTPMVKSCYITLTTQAHREAADIG